MKNYFLLLLAVFVSFNLNSQEQIYWTEVSLEVTSGKAPLVYKLVDDFYSSIDFPEGSALTLNAIQNKSLSLKTEMKKKIHEETAFHTCFLNEKNDI